MLADLSSYYELGRKHVLFDPQLNHYIFLIASLTLHRISNWGGMLLVATLFTVFNVLSASLVNVELLESFPVLAGYCMPGIILLACLSNLFTQNENPANMVMSYIYSAAYGFFHGLSFGANVGPVAQTAVWKSYFMLSLGLEVGQVVIIGIIIVLSFIFVSVFRVDRRDWKLVLSSAAGGIAVLNLLSV